jgi:hypothetical protein
VDDVTIRNVTECPNYAEGEYRGRGFAFKGRDGQFALHWLDASGGLVKPAVVTGVCESAGGWDHAEVAALVESLVRAVG